MRTKLYAYVAAAALIPATAVAVGPRLGELRGSIGADAEFEASGDVFDSASYDLSGAILDGDTIGNGGGDVAFGAGTTMTVNNTAFNNAYDVAVGAHAELAYGVTDDFEVFGQVTWLRSRGSSTTFGTITDPSLAAPIDVRASYEDMDSWEIALGGRYYFAGGSFRPFFGGSVGARFTDDMNANFSIPALNSGNAAVRLYEGTTVYTAGIESGLAFGSEDSVSGMFSVGVKYVSSPDKDGDGLRAIGIEPSLADGDQVTIPVKGSLSVHF